MTNHKQTKRGIAAPAFLVIMVVLLAAAFGVYQLEQKAQTNKNPNPTGSSTPTTNIPTGWANYEDPILGFNLNHPATWQSTVSTENGRLIELSGGSAGHLRIYAISVPVNQELEAYLTEKDRLNATGYEGQPAATVYASKHLTLDGVPAIEREESWNAAGFSHILVTYLKRGEKVIVIQELPVAEDGTVTSADQTLYRQIVASISFAPITPAAVTPITPATSTPSGSVSTPTGPKVTLHFQDSKNLATNCEATYVVERTIAPTPRVAGAVLDILFAENLTKLRSAYHNVTITNGVATVDFSPAALTYLNGAACEQASFKTAIEETLKEFSTVKTVQYSIDGKVFTDWDA